MKGNLVEMIKERVWRMSTWGKLTEINIYYPNINYNECMPIQISRFPIKNKIRTVYDIAKTVTEWQLIVETVLRTF